MHKEKAKGTTTPLRAMIRSGGLPYKRTAVAGEPRFEPDDPEWWEEFCHKYYEVAASTAFRMLGDGEMAEDVAIHTFRELKRHPPEHFPPSFSVLVERTARAIAASLLSARFAGLMYARALHLVGNAKEAEEVMTSVRENLLRRSASCPPGALLEAFALTVAKQAALELIRRREGGKGKDEQPAGFTDEVPEEGGKGSNAIDPEDLIAPSENLITPEMFAALSPGEKEAALHRLEGLSNDKIADKLGIDLEALDELLKRAFKKLRGFSADTGNKEVGDE